MATLLRHGTAGGARCSICGCASVSLDYWDDPRRDGDRDASLELGECPRCDHRWTRPLALPVPARCASPEERTAPVLTANAPREGHSRLPVAA